MLAIRMQRTGRKGHAQFRVVVQDSRFSPSSGRVVEYLGSYDPHTKATTLDKQKATTYLSNGARPSERVVRLLTAEGVKLPGWVEKPAKKERAIRNTEKLRRNRPEEPKAETPAEAEPEAPAESEAPVAPEAAVESEATVAEAEVPAEIPEAPAVEAEAAAPVAEEPKTEA
ncbi:MAG: rpsP [Candidatus Saccharibacteria bacterium]|nr:rpsP [Candidatus Saccharibacteria bacterium]